MEDYSVKKLALILAIQAEIEGMKAFNARNKFNVDGAGYSEIDFQNKAEELRNLAYAHEDQLFGN